MAQGADRNSGKKVEVFVASVIPEVASCTLNEQRWKSIIGVHDVFVVGSFDRVVFEHRGTVAWRGR